MKTVSYFDIDPHPRGIGSQTVKGGLFSVGSQFVRFTSQLLGMMVLARLLQPSDFGIFAMVNVVVVFVNLFRDIGFSNAIVQKTQITHHEISNLFWINVLITIFVSGVLIAVSPLIANFYEEDKLRALVVICGFILMIRGGEVIHRALLQRSMKFRLLATLDTVAAIVGVTAAVISALHGLGYWSFVIQNITMAVLSCFFTILLANWRPSFPKLNITIKPYLHYSSNLFGFSILNYFSRHADNILIGWKYGANTLGLYERAYSLLLFPLNQINGPIGAVMLPALSKVKNNPEKYRVYYSKSVSFVLSITFPLVGFFWINTEGIILLCYGEEWLNIVPVFQALIPAAFISASNISTGWVYVSLGTTNRQFKWTLFAAPFHVISMLIGLNWGSIGVAWAISLSFAIIRLPYLIYTIRGTCLKFSDVTMEILKPLIVSIVSAILVIAFSHLLPWGIWCIFIVKIALYGLLILTLDRLLNKKEEWIVNKAKEMISYLR